MIVNTKDVNKCLIKIQQGDTSYMEPLFNKTANHLIVVAKFYLTNKSLADDVVSTTYIKALQYIHSFDPKQSGYNWMCKIVQNTAQTFNDREQKIYIAQGKSVADQPTEYYDNGFNANLDFDDMLRQLKGTDQIIAFRRFYLDETLEQIGAKLNISRAAVHNRVKKICKDYKKIAK